MSAPSLPLAEEDPFAVIERCLGRLPHRESLVLRLRMGLGAEPARSFAEIAVKLGLPDEVPSYEAVKEIYEQAVDKLSAMPELQELAVLLGEDPALVVAGAQPAGTSVDSAPRSRPSSLAEGC